MNNARSCLIKIEDDALLVANTGMPFGRLDVVAVCASHLGTKQNYRPTDPAPGSPNTELIKKIRSNEIETYKLNPNRLKEDFSGEKETQLDYGGRVIWELLQNADDAMAPKGTSLADLIGVKGLGFKSVLEVTEEPEIYSGEFNFCFSAIKTQELIKKEIKEIEDVPLLTFRIPHEVSPDSIIKELQKDYVSVIRLPLREEKEGIVQEWLEKLAPECMIFFQYIEELKIILPNQAHRIYSCKRDKLGELTDCDISIKEEIEDKTFQYRLWTKTWSGESGGKRHSAAISLPLKEGKPVSFNRIYDLYVFLPTSEQLPFYALIHGSFDLDQSRKHVRNPQGHISHRDKFADLISRIVDSVPVSTVLRALVPDQEPEQSTVASFLWEIIKEKMAGKEFVPCVGGGKVTPEKVRLWEYNLGKVVDSTSEKVKDLNLAEPELIPKLNHPLSGWFSFGIIGQLAENITRNMRNMTFTCTRGGNYNDRVDNSNNSSFHVSFAYWQLSEVAWLPCKPSLIHKDSWISTVDGYLPGKGLGGLLPEIDIALDDNQEGRDIETLLVKTLRVRETLPREDELQWSNWLNDLPGHVTSFPDKEKALKSVKKLWEKVLTFKDSSRLLSINKIPCVVWRDENEILEFKSKSQVYWVDEGYLNERSTRNALLKKGYSLFILELQEGKHINKLFNVSRLSEKIDVEHYSDGKNECLSTTANERYQERYEDLKTIQSNIKLPNPDSLLIYVVKNLKLKVSRKDGQEIVNDISRPFWIKEEKTFVIDEETMWEGFGLALTDSSSSPGISSLFENIMKEENRKGVLRRLREAGVPETTVHELEQSIALGIPKTTDGTVKGKLDKPSDSRETVKPTLPSHPKDSKTIHPTGKDGDMQPHTEKVETGVTRQPHGSTQVRKNKGKGAEDWFRYKLKELLGSHGWHISEGPERDEDNLESDIVLTHNQKGTYHIEVKHAEANTLYWSIKEVEKARKNQERYWMVIIRPNEDRTEYRCILIEDPLETLKHNERNGTWLWQGREDNVPVNEGWYPPEPKPMKEANNFSFQISINDSRFNWNKFPDAFDFINGKLIET